MKKKLVGVLIIAMLVLGLEVTSFAADRESPDSTAGAIGYSSTIPERMAPNTIIEYTDSSRYVILQGGESTEPIPQEVLAARKQHAGYINFSESPFAAVRATDLSKAITIPPTLPSKGLRVTYRESGGIHLILPAGNATLKYTVGKYAPNGTYQWRTSSSMPLNTMTITSDSVTGSGRLTTYNDEKGDHNNTLKKTMSLLNMSTPTHQTTIPWAFRQG
jgi:hypothetical protein